MLSENILLFMFISLKLNFISVKLNFYFYVCDFCNRTGKTIGLPASV